jgi:phosphatidylglycerol:prolipoprotein diacylglycerol transferase
MILRIDHPQFFYDLFYQLSFLVVILIFLIEGSRRNLPWISLLLVAVTTRFFVITGSKLAGINADDVNFFIQHFSFPPEHAKNMAGALFFGLIGLGLSKLILRIKYPVLDVFAIATPFGMAIQRIGCLLAGCCFGNETSSPWGIQYGTNSPAFFHQFYSGRLNFANELSLHIHPIPIYLIISSLLIGIVLLRFRNYWKRPGNLAFSGLALILVSWFVIEFFRDPLSNGTFLGATFFGLKRIQVIYLTLISVLIMIIFYREKLVVQRTIQIQENHPIHNSLYLVGLIGLIIATRNWFTPIEFSVLLFVLIPASVGVLVQVVRHFYTVQVRTTVAFLILISFIIMGQTLPEKEKTIYQSLKLGYSGGNFDNYHDIGTGTGCDRNSQSQDFHQKYRLMGVGYSITEEQNKQLLEYGINGYFGSHTELALTSRNETNHMFAGINPFIKYDIKWWGIGGGLHIGDLSYTPFEWIEEKAATLPTTGTKQSPVLPQFYFRFGPRNIVFISYKFADQFPSPFPGMYQNLELGSGFGLNNGFILRVGSFFKGTYFAGTIPISNQLILEPLFEMVSNSETEFPNPYQFSLGLHYRFGHKTQAVKSKE